MTEMSTLEHVETDELLDCGHRMHLWCIYRKVDVPPVRACDVEDGGSSGCKVCGGEPPICATCVELEPTFISTHNHDSGRCLLLHLLP